jgi:nitrate reductase beta subunit
MLFYVPPLGPVLAKTGNGVYDNVETDARLGPLMSSLERSRIPLRYMASLLSGGNEEIIRDVYRKMVAVRVYMRAKKVKDIPQDEVERALREGKTTGAEVEAIFRLTSLPTFEERFVVPPMERDTSVESMFPVLDPVSRNYPVYKGAVGTGFHINPQRGP